jgi:hypothetical protein
MKAAIRTGFLAVAAVGCLLADASYSETVRFEGGSLVEMLRGMANGPMGKTMGQAFQDQTYAVYVKGNKMARIGSLTSTITDLDAGTMTNINHTKKTYSLTSFDEMKQMQAQMQSRMKSGDTNVDFDIKVDKTGNTKKIDGQTATEYLMTMTAKDAGSDGGMKVVSHVWMGPSEPGAEEIRAFQKKMAAQYKDALAGGGNPMMGGAMKGLAAASAHLATMDGVSVETHMQVSGVASPMGPMAQQGGDPNAPAMIMGTENKNYTSGSVDDSKFAIPEGYQKVERNMGPRRGRPPQDQ